MKREMIRLNSTFEKTAWRSPKIDEIFYLYVRTREGEREERSEDRQREEEGAQERIKRVKP